MGLARLEYVLFHVNSNDPVLSDSIAAMGLQHLTIKESLVRMRYLLAAAVAAIFLVTTASAAADPSPAKLPNTTADHSKFEVLDKDFATGPEVTKACLSCHTEASKQIHQTQH